MLLLNRGWLLCLALTCFGAGETFAQQQAGNQQPNFLIVIADDCTYRDLGAYGGQAKTPNINRLAEQGMKFERCFQAAPMCSPTRHNLYTGIYPVSSGAYPNHTFVEEGTKSIAHYLKDQGYRVALSGKTHIGPKSSFPFEYSGKKNPDMDAVDQLMSECADSQTPFCLVACSNEPHSPWNKGDASQYPADEVELPPYLVDTPVVRKNFSDYLAEVSYFDSQVGQLMDLLNKHQLDENTVVIVLSEQGNSFPFAKWTCYGNGLQSAMIVRWPGMVAAGSSTPAMVEYVDVLPTILEAANAPIPDRLQGKSFASVLQGKTNEHKQHVFGLMTTRGIHSGSDLYAIRTVRNDRYRLIWNLNSDQEFQNACTHSDYFRSMVAKAQQGDESAQQLVHKYQVRPEFELYDCQADPLEMNNLAQQSAHRETLEELKVTLQQWMQQQGDEGVETERKAILHQGGYKGLDFEQALKKYEQQRSGKKRGARKNAGRNQ